MQAMLDKKDEMKVQDETCVQFGEFIITCLLLLLVQYIITFPPPPPPFTNFFPNCNISDLDVVRDRKIEDLSGGELQRFACAIVCIQRADM